MAICFVCMCECTFVYAPSFSLPPMCAPLLFFRSLSLSLSPPPPLFVVYPLLQSPLCTSSCVEYHSHPPLSLSVSALSCGGMGFDW